MKIANAGGETAVQTGTVLNTGDTITTGDSAVADLFYGTTGIIRINEKTRVSVTQLVSPDMKGDTDLSIDRGKMFVTVAKLTKGSAFTVKSPTAIAAVRGTTFKVSAEKSSSRIDVLAGKVKVNPVREGKVIEESERIVEVNNTVTLDTKTVEKIFEKKQEIEVAVMKPEEIREIREEIKALKPVEKLDPVLKQEIEQVVIDKPEEEVKKEDDSAKQLEEIKKREALEGQRRAEIERRRLERERLEKERLEKERIAREKQEQKEKRVKNIPTL